MFDRLKYQPICVPYIYRTFNRLHLLHRSREFNTWIYIDFTVFFSLYSYFSIPLDSAHAGEHIRCLFSKNIQCSYMAYCWSPVDVATTGTSWDCGYRRLLAASADTNGDRMKPPPIVNAAPWRAATANEIIHCNQWINIKLSHPKIFLTTATTSEPVFGVFSGRDRCL